MIKNKRKKKKQRKWLYIQMVGENKIINMEIKLFKKV